MQRIALEDFSSEAEVLIESVQFEAPKCLVYTNFLKLNEEFGRHHLRDLYVGRNQTIPEIRLHRLPPGVEVSVRDDEDFIVCQGDRILAEQLRPHWTDDDLAVVIVRSPTAAALSQETVLLPRFGLRTWGHWVIELLPKVACVERVYPGRFYYAVPECIITDINLRAMRQTLSAYGISRDRLLVLRNDRKYQFSNLFAVSPVWFAQRALHPQVAALLRVVVPPAAQTLAVPKNIALLRRDSSTRNLANLDQVSRYLEDQGWFLIEPSYLDFPDQVRLFAGCENIVSILGSGMAGLVYAAEGVKVATLAPSNWSEVFFYTLMQERRARFADIRGLSAGNDFKDAQRLPFTLDIADLEAGLQALGAPNGWRPSAPAATVIEEWNRKQPIPPQLFHTALRLRDAGKFAAAERLLQRLIERAPDELVLHIELVNVLMWQGNLSEAIGAAERVLAIYPSAAMLRLVQDHLSRTGHHVEAVTFARREIAADDHEPEAYSRLGHALCRVNEFGEAAEMFERALRLRGDDLGLYLALSRALCAAHRADRATEVLRTAITVHPNEPALYLQLGQALAIGRQFEAAADALNRTIALDPGNAEARRILTELNVAPRRGPTELPTPATLAGPDESSLRLDYVRFLTTMKRILRPRTYLEVGIKEGAVLFSDPLPDFVIGIDPDPKLGGAAIDRINACRTVLIIRSTSDEAFAELLSQKILGNRLLDLTFIDGLHHCEAALRDIANCARLAREGALIFVHDVFPWSEGHARREPTDGAWMGDVYKVVPVIWRHLGWIPTLLIQDILPSGIFILRVTGDVHNAIFTQYDAFVAEMATQELAPAMAEMRARSVGVTSREFSAFIEMALSTPP